MIIVEDFSLKKEKQLQEFMDKALKKLNRKVSSNGRAEYSFTMKGNTPDINEYREDITFFVNFSTPSSTFTTIERPDLLGVDSIDVKLKTTNLTFNNDISHMSELGGEDGWMTRNLGYPKDVKFSALAVYGTIGRILFDYVGSVSDNYVQNIHFSTAHEGLVKPYLILSKESERKADLINSKIKRFTGQQHETFDLIKKETFLRLKNELYKRGKA